MKCLIALVCLIAALGLCQGHPVAPYGVSGYGLPWHYPAVSTANLVKGSPISVVKTVAAPLLTGHLFKPHWPAHGIWGDIGHWGHGPWGVNGHWGHGPWGLHGAWGVHGRWPYHH